MELFEFDHFLMLRCLDTFEGGKLVVSLLVKLSLNTLHESVELLDPILLRFLYLLDRTLHLTNVVFKVS